VRLQGFEVFSKALKPPSALTPDLTIKTQTPNLTLTPDLTLTSQTPDLNQTAATPDLTLTSQTPDLTSDLTAELPLPSPNLSSDLDRSGFSDCTDGGWVRL